MEIKREKIEESNKLIYETIDDISDNEYYVLIIYDIISNKRRNKFAKLLKGYGFRVQKSSFEAYITKRVFNRMLKEINKFADDTDTIRVYKILNKNQVYLFGSNECLEGKRIIII